MTNIGLCLYTDGASSNNGKPGAKAGYGYVLVENNEVVIFEETGKEVKGSGYIPGGTNNQGELLGIIKGLSQLRESGLITSITPISVMSDSAYCINGITSWMHKWKSLGWKRDTKGAEVKNLELWQELYDLDATLNVTWVKVKGHSGNKFNDVADKLATSAAKGELV